MKKQIQELKDNKEKLEKLTRKMNNLRSNLELMRADYIQLEKSIIDNEKKIDQLSIKKAGQLLRL